ncbi:MAG: chemotaxis protein CheA [Rhodospirillales bacterium]
MGAFDHLKSTYFQECGELLDSAYVQLAALDEGTADDDTIHAVFRAIHSIKGGGGAFGFDRMVAFAHVLETLLDLVRDDRVAFGRELGALLLRATDALSDLVAADRTGQPVAAGFENALLAELAQAASQPSPQGALASPQGALASPQGALASTQGALPSVPQPLAEPPAGGYHIRFMPHADLFASANEPLLLIRALQRLGTVHITADLARLPPLETMDPDRAYIGWTIDLATPASLADIEEIFDFVTDHCDLSIVAASGSDPAAAKSPPDGPAAEPAAQVPGARLPPGPDRRVQADRRAERGERRAEAPSVAQTVRVDVEKVDRLVNLVGELVINQAMLIQLGSLLAPDTCPGLIGGLETLSQHLRELQEGVMAIRTQPVKSVFSRMPRLVRELSAQLGKEARLFITGEGTEIDKTVIELLADPLTHLLRNALDHGIERPEQRIAAGKQAEGSIHLSAEHRSGRIVIEVSDDGRGIDRERVLARARERGLVAADAQPGEEEIDNLIFLPGFSTVEVVSNVSGRGVGMDVVRRNVQALGGRISLQSRAGAGSRFVLSLPLTLAILDGMIVAVGAESYIVPLTNIVESLRPKRSEIHAVAGCGDVVAIRGQYIPLVHLAHYFSVPDAEQDASRGIVVVVEHERAGHVGLVVDELVGQQQVVVKSLETNYGAVQGIGGATILGNGRVALILDVAGLHGAAVAGRRADARRLSAADATTSVIQ